MKLVQIEQAKALTSLIEEIPNALIVITEAGELRYLNKGAENLFGLSKSTMLNQNIKKFIPVHDAFNKQESTKKKWSAEDNKNSFYCLKPNGQKIPLKIDTNHYNVEGENFIAASLKDVSSSQLRERILLKAMKKTTRVENEKNMFVASLSHEIRTPMSAILGCSELLLKKITNPALTKYLAIIQTNIRSIVRLIDNTLEISKLESGEVKLSKEKVNMEVLLSEIEDLFDEEIKRKKLKFNIEFDNNLQRFLVLDEIRIKQIITNLISNSIKNTKEGHITLSLSGKSEENNDSVISLIIEVQDSGQGIPVEDQAHIFDFYHQSENQSQDSKFGVGLGLSICKKLINAMDGKITLNSEVDKGTKFQVFLPHISISKSAVNG